MLFNQDMKQDIILEPGVVTLQNGRNEVRGRPMDSPHLDPTALRNRNLV